ncbi:SpoIIE family protein phosphatase [Streptomyces sp. AC536]|uniref:PP2C family protein-serine/threonine phosphatase n=1 Tax=Streptomyces buecherae TaxID=2763006 RepID=UPI00164E584E|nr:PP2C family protein-serine/threonine phosphatase [Streptomyces buecherae]MBC3984796.1 SpoIIE family protein phosphatase [Streptomyces buecherae]QNJ41303.1 SpoIIE family protein phosphatase [Streptomyces buecherae]
MSAHRLPKVAGIDSAVSGPSQNPAPTPAAPSPPADAAPSAHQSASAPPTGPTGAPSAGGTPYTAVQDRLAGWVSDLTTLHELTERLAHATTLDDALRELLRAGAALVGAQRGMAALEPTDGLGPELTIGLGLGRAELGHIETIPRASGSVGRLLDGLPAPAVRPPYGGERPGPAPTDQPTPDGTAPPHDAWPSEVAHPDIASEDDLDPHHREVAARLGYAASYALPLEPRAQPLAPPHDAAGHGPESATPPGADGPAGRAPVTPVNPALVVEPAPPRGRIGAVVWLYDEPTEPTARQRHLVGLYCRYAAEHIGRHIELHRDRRTVATLREELLPSRLPRVPGVRLAARHHTGPFGGGDWYDALPLPEGALGLSIGGVTGSGPSAVAAMGRLRASLRAYAVLEGEDPVAVLSDLELLLRLTEPARAATALFAYCEPAHRSVVLAGAGHCPPLLIGDEHTAYVETSLSAPLGMLACWEAPSVGIEPGPGETLLLYSDGLLRRTGAPMDQAFARLHAAAASVPRAGRRDPDAVVDHVLRAVLPDGPDAGRGPLEAADAAADTEDIVLLAACFD